MPLRRFTISAWQEVIGRDLGWEASAGSPRLEPWLGPCASLGLICNLGLQPVQHTQREGVAM